MAKQMGIIKLQGTIGDITFYKSQDGYLAREKGGIDGDRIATDPAFERTRENGAEFGRAGKAAKLLRNSIQGLLQNVSDSRLASRLTTEMVKVVKADATSTRGMRNVIDGEVELLQGFEFNINGKLTTALYAPYDVVINRATGQFTVTVPPFIPAHMIAAPVGATHFRINSGASEVDFENGKFTVDTKQTTILPLDNMPTAAINLESALTPASVHPLFQVLGIEFLQQVNGEFYPLKNGAFNALALVQVSGV
jgi:hypothetical protein